MPQGKIKIFIASSKELKEDRDEFANFIAEKNDRANDAEPRLELVRWERFPNSISTTRLQDEYNQAIRESDMAIFLVFTKVGKYTEEEFNTALQAFTETKKQPLIYTYFKNDNIKTGDITDEEIGSMLAFKKKLKTLGHFYTPYPNIDNLIRDFDRQLNYLQVKKNQVTVQAHPGGSFEVAEPVLPSKPLNERLTRRLIEAVKEYNPKAVKFLDWAKNNSTDWETISRFSDQAKIIIISSFVGVVGIQLRKLMAIGKDGQLKDYLENCQITAKRALQLLCFALISKLWDHGRVGDFVLSEDQKYRCNQFFDNEYELNINDFNNLLLSLIDVYNENNLQLPVSELKEFGPVLKEESYVGAIRNLDNISSLLDRCDYTAESSLDAESDLCKVLETLKFLVNYKMVSIKTIGYFEMRHRQPQYLYNCTDLEIGIAPKADKESVEFKQVPINTDAVLMHQGDYQQNLNLFPFILDQNALDSGDGAKIYFYESRAEDNLTYKFLENNSSENELQLNAQKRKDMKMESVYELFLEARKTITG